MANVFAKQFPCVLLEINMAESFKEKDKKFVSETVNLLVKQSNFNDRFSIYTTSKPGELPSEDRRVTVTLSKDDIRKKTDRTVVRGDAIKNIANQFEQYGCTTEITKDQIRVTCPVVQTDALTLEKLEQSVKEKEEEEDRLKSNG